MLAITPFPFVRISRDEQLVHTSAPEQLEHLANGFPFIPEKDLAEQVSDALLYFSSINFYELVVSNNLIHFREIPSDIIVQRFCLTLAWTLWLPFTLLGMLIILFSESHAELYYKVHAQSWSDQTESAINTGDTGKLKALFEAAIDFDFLFKALLYKIGTLPNPNGHIPILLDCCAVRESRGGSMLWELLINLPFNYLRLYMEQGLLTAASPENQLLQDKIFDFCFNPSASNTVEEIQSTVVAGFMGIMEAAAKNPEGVLNIPQDRLIFSHQSRQVLQGFISKNHADVEFIKRNRETILQQITRSGIPEHKKLIRLINNLTTSQLRVVSSS